MLALKTYIQYSYMLCTQFNWQRVVKMLFFYFFSAERKYGTNTGATYQASAMTCVLQNYWYRKTWCQSCCPIIWPRAAEESYNTCTSKLMVQQIQWLCVGGRGGRNLASGSCSQNINGKQLQKPEQFSAFWHNFFLKNKAISIKLNELTSSSNIESQL